MFRHTLLSIQHPFQLKTGEMKPCRAEMVERYGVSPSIGRARAKVVLSRSYFGETAAEIGRVRGGNLKMSGCRHLQ